MFCFNVWTFSSTLTLLAFVLCVQGTDRFGLTHQCLTQSECASDRLICIDSDFSGDICHITCGSLGQYNSCDGATFVIANSGGLQLDCLRAHVCENSEVIWVNSDNLATFQALSVNAAIGGALHSLHCAGFYGCYLMAVNGQMQEDALDVVTQWMCDTGTNACNSVTANLHAVSLSCADRTDICRGLKLTCLGGGNCESNAANAETVVGASMTCEAAVVSCICSEFFTCIALTAIPTTTTTTVLPTFTEVTTTEGLLIVSTTKKMTTTTKLLTSTDVSTTTKAFTTTKGVSTTLQSTVTTSEKVPTTTRANADASTTASTAVPTESNSDNNSGGMSILVIGLLVVTSLLGICALTALFYFGYRKFYYPDFSKQQSVENPIAAAMQGLEMQTATANIPTTTRVDSAQHLDDTKPTKKSEKAAVVVVSGGQTTDARPLEDSDTVMLKKIFVQMKADAHTMEELTAASKLIRALALAPAKLNREFQALCQLDADMHFTGELLLDVANRILRRSAQSARVAEAKDVSESSESSALDGGECVTGGREDSEDRREAKDALSKVAKMERDEKDLGFGQELASLRVVNDMLEEDVVEGMGVVGEGDTQGYHYAEEKAQEFKTPGATDHLLLDESSSFDDT